MNFKRNLLSIITLIGCVFTVSGCDESKAFKEFEFFDKVKDAHKDEDFESYIRYGEYSSYQALGPGEKTTELGSSYDVIYKYAGQHIIKHSADLKTEHDYEESGEDPETTDDTEKAAQRKILVVPVEFEDFTTDDLGVSKSDYLDNLEKAFFGVAKNNRYVSVSEFYNRSSYGKLRLSGKVCKEFFTFPETVDNIIKKELTSNVVRDCYQKVIDWYGNNHRFTSLNEYRIDPSDANSDIAIYLVYTYPTELKKNTKVFWDYTFLDKPFAWSSYSCMNTLAGLPDAHTLIHETGHLLGLPDYYPSDDTDPDPTGRIDMMDCSVGDHTGFSKMMLNWARPYHVKDNCQITLNPLVNSGDLILLNDSWNRSVFDEYYLVEFYSPTGLNNYDSNVGNNKAKLPYLPGIKIYHVDARLGYFESEADPRSSDTKLFKQYCDVAGDYGPNKTTKNVNFAHTNSKNTTATLQPSYNLYELQLNKVFTVSDQCAGDENLFHIGDSFEITEESFNKKNSTSYKITVGSLSYIEAKITIEKIQTTQE